MSRGLFWRVLSLSKQIFSFIAFIFLPLSHNAFAQSVENRYRSHIDANGITFFICPKQIGGTVNVNEFVYDMTYHTSADSVILNFTIISDRPRKVNTLILSCGDTRYVGESVKPMFADIRGRKYEIRTTSRFSLKDICEVFSHKEALSFQMSLDSGVEASATYSSSKWKKDANLISRIFDLIIFQR